MSDPAPAPTPVAGAAEQGCGHTSHSMWEGAPVRMGFRFAEDGHPCFEHCPAAPGPDRALELLRELVRLDGDGPADARHWRDDWSTAMERARALVEDEERVRADPHAGRLG